MGPFKAARIAEKQVVDSLLFLEHVLYQTLSSPKVEAGPERESAALCSDITSWIQAFGYMRLSLVSLKSCHSPRSFRLPPLPWISQVSSNTLKLLL